MAASQNRKKKRLAEHIEPIQERFYIFCEGTKTEVNYFQGFKSAIESNAIYRNIVHIEVEGVGAETLRVVDAAEKYVKRNQIKEAQIWCAYDKDDFPAKDFNAAYERIRSLNEQQNDVEYFAAWSNESFEYWFVLHFGRYTANNGRGDYKRFLDRKFKELGLRRYDKTDKNLFDIMTKKGKPKLAIHYAEERLQECEGKTDAESVPATRVHLLVKQMIKYLPEALQPYYL